MLPSLNRATSARSAGTPPVATPTRFSSGAYDGAQLAGERRGLAALRVAEQPDRAGRRQPRARHPRGRPGGVEHGVALGPADRVGVLPGRAEALVVGEHDRPAGAAAPG